MSNLPGSPNGSPGAGSADPDQADAADSGRSVPIGLIIGSGIAVLVLIAVLGVLIWAGVNNPETTRVIRDVFIIFLALMSILVVVALVVLIILVARLILMLQNEIKPLLETIEETLHTLRGTAVFMSENLVTPVVRTAGYVEGARRFVEVLAGMRPRTKKRP